MERPNHVCLDCQIANKTGGKCPECAKPMECIGHNWRVPKRGHRDWKKVEQLVAEKRRRGLHRDSSPTSHNGDAFTVGGPPRDKVHEQFERGYAPVLAQRHRKKVTGKTRAIRRLQRKSLHVSV